eukprot:756649-Hanusia_phi.AAC.14
MLDRYKSRSSSAILLRSCWRSSLDFCSASLNLEGKRSQDRSSAARPRDSRLAEVEQACVLSGDDLPAMRHGAGGFQDCLVKFQAHSVKTLNVLLHSDCRQAPLCTLLSSNPRSANKLATPTACLLSSAWTLNLFFSFTSVCKFSSLGTDNSVSLPRLSYRALYIRCLCASVKFFPLSLSPSLLSLSLSLSLCLSVSLFLSSSPPLPSLRKPHCQASLQSDRTPPTGPSGPSPGTTVSRCPSRPGGASRPESGSHGAGALQPGGLRPAGPVLSGCGAMMTATGENADHKFHCDSRPHVD